MEPSGPLPPLPKEFLFGVATADHQCEAFDPSFPPDVWDWWEQRGAVPQSRGAAIDFWNRYPEYLDWARELGCTAFRFSIAWARVEPRRGFWDPSVLRHYADVVEAIRSRGMEPVVTLCHYTWPLHLEQSGGLLGPAFPEHFAEYAARVRDAVGNQVRYWLTFNEPDDLVTSHSRLNPRFPPGAPVWVSLQDQISDMEALIRNLFRAHRFAREAIRHGPGGEGRLVSMNSDLRGYPIYVRRLINGLLCSRLLWSRGGRALRRGATNFLVGQVTGRRTWLTELLLSVAALVEGDWWELGSLGHLPEYLCPRHCDKQLDYLAFDYYYAVKHVWQLGRLAASLGGQFERAPVYAEGLFDVLRYFDQLTYGSDHASPDPHKPIFVVENGLVDQKGAFKLRGEAPPAEAVGRASYIRDHVRQVQRARSAGVNVIGYLVWSLTSNREWGLRFGPGTDFGLYHLDLDNDPGLTNSSIPLRRRSSDGVDEYRRIIERRGV